MPTRRTACSRPILIPSVPIAKIGMGGQVQRQSASFAKGNYYVELVETSADPNSDQSALLNAFAAGC